jgi:7-keto-8-aminopelargonate synthetase-like enzyme
MGNTDSVPVLSQVKSLVQVIAGDEEGARKTQENFLQEGIIASQVSIPLLKRCVSQNVLDI